MENNKYTHRLIARVVIETTTPIAIGTGTKDILTDSLVATDTNGLPYIPGTAVAGILRHAVGDFNEKSSLFGFQEGNDGHGACLMFTDALMIGKEGKPLDGLCDGIDWEDDFYRHFKELPIRQHVRIDDKGVAAKTGKFDNQVAYKGLRFVFEMEALTSGEKEKEELFDDLLRQLNNPVTRIGSGTRNGYGAFEVVDCRMATLNLEDKDDLKRYLTKSSSLAEECPWLKSIDKEQTAADEWTTYTLSLQPDDFFLFGSGAGDDDADMTPVKELVVTYDAAGKPKFSEKEKSFIPATSVKGALAHRTAYHWNRLNKYFADDGRAKSADECDAVVAIFGSSGKNSSEITRGNIILSDMFFDKDVDTKVINHVSIDPFTGGAKEGALFSEKANYGKKLSFTLTAMVKKSALEYETTKNAFENALNDITIGMLPLGGGVNRGNGIFTGKWEKTE